jgi:hypothetical protein
VRLISDRGDSDIKKCKESVLASTVVFGGAWSLDVRQSVLC